MADITITAANVLKGTDATTALGTAGETITAGQCVYKKAADNEYYKADAATSAAVADAVGIALNGASNGQPLMIQTAGTITIGGTAVVGKIYMVSDTGGGICPQVDLGTSYPTQLGYGASATTLFIAINTSGYAMG